MFCCRLPSEILNCALRTLINPCILQENTVRPLSALEDAEVEQRSVIADIARRGLPWDAAAQDEKRLHAQAARLANPHARNVLKRFSDDKEACR